jgi:hypothetical protein
MKTLLILTLAFLCMGFLSAQTINEEINTICSGGTFMSDGDVNYFVISGLYGSEDRAVEDIAFASLMFTPVIHYWFDDIIESNNTSSVRTLDYVTAYYGNDEDYTEIIFPVNAIYDEIPKSDLLSDSGDSFQRAVQIVRDSATFNQMSNSINNNNEDSDGEDSYEE